MTLHESTLTRITNGIPVGRGETAPGAGLSPAEIAGGGGSHSTATGGVDENRPGAWARAECDAKPMLAWSGASRGAAGMSVWSRWVTCPRLVSPSDALLGCSYLPPVSRLQTTHSLQSEDRCSSQVSGAREAWGLGRQTDGHAGPGPASDGQLLGPSDVQAGYQDAWILVLWLCKVVVGEAGHMNSVLFLQIFGGLKLFQNEKSILH